MIRRLLLGFILLMLLLGSATVQAEGELNDELSGMWERIYDDDNYFITILTLNMEQGTFEETTRARKQLGLIRTIYKRGRLEAIQKKGRETNLAFVDDKPALLTLKPEGGGGLTVYTGCHLNQGDKLRDEVAFFHFPPQAEKQAEMAAKPHQPESLNGVWLKAFEDFKISLTIDQFQGRYIFESDYGVIKAGFKIVETRPDRYFVELPGYSIESKLTLEADGTLGITSGADYVERYKRVDPASFMTTATEP